MFWFWMRVILAVLLGWTIISICVSLILGPILARAGHMKFYEFHKTSEEEDREDHR